MSAILDRMAGIVGAKNIIREKLINSYNQAPGKKTADQVYFTDFVVQ